MILLTETDTIPITVGLSLFVGGVASAVAGGILWIKREQSKIRRQFFRIISKHNREDDEILGALCDGLWDIRARNARKDGEPLPQRQSPRRRRYLMDDTENYDGGEHDER